MRRDKRNQRALNFAPRSRWAQRLWSHTVASFCARGVRKGNGRRKSVEFSKRGNLPGLQGHSQGMNKKILAIGGILVVLVAGSYVAVAFFMGSIVKAGVNKMGPRLTQSKVELASASLSPLTGVGTLSGLSVGNPAGWSEGRAFYLGSVHVEMEPRSVFGEPIVINELTIDRPEFNYETRFVSSNIKDLLNNIQAYTGKGEPAGRDEKPKKFIVKKFRLTNGKATLGVGSTAVPVPLPAISLDNLGVAEGGITSGQLAGAIMQDVLGTIVAGTADALGKIGATAGAAGFEKSGEAAKKAEEAIKKLFGGKK